MELLIRNSWDHLGPSHPEEKVYSVRFMVLLFQVVLAEKWDDSQKKQLCAKRCCLRLVL